MYVTGCTLCQSGEDENLFWPQQRSYGSFVQVVTAYAASLGGPWFDPLGVHQGGSYQICNLNGFFLDDHRLSMTSSLKMA